MWALFLLLIHACSFTDAVEFNKDMIDFTDLDKKLHDILHEFHKCQVETNEIINMMKKELEEIRMENNMLKVEMMNAQDIKDIADDVEELKNQMENRRTEIGILQDHDFQKEVKIKSLENKIDQQSQDINDLSIEVTADIDEVKIKGYWHLIPQQYSINEVIFTAVRLNIVAA